MLFINAKVYRPTTYSLGFPRFGHHLCPAVQLWSFAVPFDLCRAPEFADFDFKRETKLCFSKKSSLKFCTLVDLYTTSCQFKLQHHNRLHFVSVIHICCHIVSFVTHANSEMLNGCLGHAWCNFMMFVTFQNDLWTPARLNLSLCHYLCWIFLCLSIHKQTELQASLLPSCI